MVELVAGQFLTVAVLNRKLAQLYPQACDRQAALEALERYGAAPHEREPLRVRLAILKLAGSDAARLVELVQIAQRDYRDVLAWAEYPGEGRTFPDLRSPGALHSPSMVRVRAEDRAQYMKWLRE